MAKSDVEVFVYIQFPPEGKNWHGLQYSIEPRKWITVIERGCFTEYNEQLRAYGYSEWPTSLNLKLSCPAERLGRMLSRLKGHFTGCAHMGLFEPTPQTALLQNVPSKILPFRQAA